MVIIHYNFDEEINRYNTGSMKWDMIESMDCSNKILPMWVADLDFKSPDEVVEALRKRVEQGVYGYSYMDKDQYSSMIEWFKRNHNLQLNSSHMLENKGTVDIMTYAIIAFTDINDKVTILTPIYTPFFNCIKFNNRKIEECVLIPEGDQYYIDFEESISRSKLFLLCNPHNPMGRVWTEYELKKMGEICIKHNVIIVSDEVHCDYVFEGYKHIPISTLSEELLNNTITCLSPSKTFNIAGLQTAVAVIPNKEKFEKFVKIMDLFHAGQPNIFSVEAAKAAYLNGETWLREVKEYIYENYLYVKSFLADNIPEIRCTEIQATYLIWLDLRNIANTDEKVREIMERKANILGKTGKSFGDTGEGFYRLNIGTTRKNVEIAMNSLLSALRG